MPNKYCPICGSKHTKRMVHAIENSDINVAIAGEYFNINATKESFDDQLWNQYINGYRTLKSLSTRYNFSLKTRF